MATGSPSMAYYHTHAVHVPTVCVNGAPAESDTGSQTALNETWQAWQILETRTGRTLLFEEWLKILEQYDIIYLGRSITIRSIFRQHSRYWSSWWQTDWSPQSAWRCSVGTAQAALDDYVSTNRPVTNEFLEQVRWKQNWGGAFEDYAPLVTFARDHHLSVRAMNPPKPLIRRVVQLGLEQAKGDPEWAAWGSCRTKS